MATGAGTMGQSVLLLRNFHHGDTWESEREREREENRDEGQIPLTHLPACCSPEAIVNIAVRGGSNYMYSTNPLKTQCWSLNSYCKKRQKHLTLRAWLRYLKNSDQCIKWTSLIHSMYAWSWSKNWGQSLKNVTLTKLSKYCDFAMKSLDEKRSGIGI